MFPKKNETETSIELILSKIGCLVCAKEEGKKKIQRKVAQMNLETMEIIQTFNSIEDAARHLGIGSGNIPTVCNGKRPLTGGYIWKYINE